MWCNNGWFLLCVHVLFFRPTLETSCSLLRCLRWALSWNLIRVLSLQHHISNLVNMFGSGHNQKPRLWLRLHLIGCFSGSQKPKGTKPPKNLLKKTKTYTNVTVSYKSKCWGTWKGYLHWSNSPGSERLPPRSYPAWLKYWDAAEETFSVLVPQGPADPVPPLQPGSPAASLGRPGPRKDYIADIWLSVLWCFILWS